MKWTEKSSKAFSFLTGRTDTPKVVRVPQGGSTTTSGERPADALRRVIESEGWAVHEDPALLELLSEVDVVAQVSRRMNDLIAEVLFFCYELDVEEAGGRDTAERDHGTS